MNSPALEIKQKIEFTDVKLLRVESDLEKLALRMLRVNFKKTTTKLLVHASNLI